MHIDHALQAKHLHRDGSVLHAPARLVASANAAPVQAQLTNFLYVRQKRSTKTDSAKMLARGMVAVEICLILIPSSYRLTDALWAAAVAAEGMLPRTFARSAMTAGPLVVKVHCEMWALTRTAEAVVAAEAVAVVAAAALGQ